MYVREREEGRRNNRKIEREIEREKGERENRKRDEIDIEKVIGKIR